MGTFFPSQLTVLLMALAGCLKPNTFKYVSLINISLIVSDGNKLRPAILVQHKLDLLAHQDGAYDKKAAQ